MKKVFLVFATLVFTAGMFVSCVPDSVNDGTETAESQAIDKSEIENPRDKGGN